MSAISSLPIIAREIARSAVITWLLLIGTSIAPAWIETSPSCASAGAAASGIRAMAVAALRFFRLLRISVSPLALDFLGRRLDPAHDRHGRADRKSPRLNSSP